MGMTYREQIAKAIYDAMVKDDGVLILGEGVSDPKGIFGTTSEPNTHFQRRVLETPLSENMLTGACLGLALEGWKPIYVHARFEFLMPAMEQLVNVVAKWQSVHRGRPFNLVFRTLIGRGWGQGPTHSQAFHGMLAHIPGLQVIYPVDPDNIGYWFDNSLHAGVPTIIMEPRRLYEIERLDYPVLSNPNVYIVTFGDIVLDAIAAAKELEKYGIHAQVWPIENVSNMQVPDTDKPVVIAETGQLFCGASSEAVAKLVQNGNANVARVGPPFTPLPTSWILEQNWYPQVKDICSAAANLIGVANITFDTIGEDDDRFQGPF